MTPDLLIKHFDRISEAPDAIPRLRCFVIELAIRGKLVPQLSSDQCVTEQLEQNDRARRETADSDSRADAARQTPLATQDRWAVPSTWEWVSLADTVLFIDYRGQTPIKVEHGVRLLTAKNVKRRFINPVPEEFISEPDYGKWMTRGIPQQGDILFTTEAPMGNAAVVRLSERFALAQRVICFRPYSAIGADFLVLQLLSDSFTAILDKTATGLTAKGIKAAKLKRLPIVVPPRAEQDRIVAKVNELMELCDSLEAAQSDRQKRGEMLVAAVNHHLINASEPKELHRHALFYFNHLARLTTTEDHINQLRLTILDLAVRGRLNFRVLEDGTSAELIRDVTAERAKLIKAGLLKKASTDILKENVDSPFEIPASWSWVPLQSLIIFGPQNGISPTPSSRPNAPKAITLTATTKGLFDSSHYKTVDADIPADSEYWLSDGDLLFQRGNTREYVGMAAYYSGSPGSFLYPDLMMKVRLSASVNLRYVHLCTISPYAREYFSTRASVLSEKYVE